MKRINDVDTGSQNLKFRNAIFIEKKLYENNKSKMKE